MSVTEAKAKVTLVSAPPRSLVGLAAKFCTSPDSLDQILKDNDEIGYRPN